MPRAEIFQARRRVDVHAEMVCAARSSCEQGQWPSNERDVTSRNQQHLIKRSLKSTKKTLHHRMPLISVPFLFDSTRNCC